MKKIFLVLLFIGLSFSIAFSVQAVDLGTGSNSLLESARNNAQYADANETTFAETIGTVIKMVLSIVGVLFLAYTVYAGYLWMTAQGEEEQVKKSQTIIKQSVIGLIIMTGAYSITAFVVPKILDRTAGEQTAEVVQEGSLVGCCFVICENSGKSIYAEQKSSESQCGGWTCDASIGDGSYNSYNGDYDCQYTVVSADQCRPVESTCDTE